MLHIFIIPYLTAAADHSYKSCKSRALWFWDILYIRCSSLLIAIRGVLSYVRVELEHMYTITHMHAAKNAWWVRVDIATNQN